jgi:hypothetical protein
MSARSLDLSFALGARRPSLVGTLLLALGVAAGAGALIDHQTVSVATQRLEARAELLERSSRRAPQPIRAAETDGKALQTEVRAANALVAQLNLPWGALFNELEAAAVEGVTLLAVQPELGTGLVRIGGEARSFDRVLTYMQRLDGREAFGEVFLVSHAMRDGVPGEPVAFTLTAEWRAR